MVQDLRGMVQGVAGPQEGDVMGAGSSGAGEADEESRDGQGGEQELSDRGLRVHGALVPGAPFSSHLPFSSPVIAPSARMRHRRQPELTRPFRSPPIRSLHLAPTSGCMAFLLSLCRSQPVPYSEQTPHGMPREFEEYHLSTDYGIVNIPPTVLPPFTSLVAALRSCGEGARVGVCGTQDEWRCARGSR
jgi:hypothetical protein